VEDNQKGAAKGAVAKSGRRTYRQYMNRRGDEEGGREGGRERNGGREGRKKWEGASNRPNERIHSPISLSFLYTDIPPSLSSSLFFFHTGGFNRALDKVKQT